MKIKFKNGGKYGKRKDKLVIADKPGNVPGIRKIYPTTKYKQNHRNSESIKIVFKNGK